MSLPVYPGRDLLKGLDYGQKWTPSFFNQSATTATGADIDVGLAQYPLHDFELTYSFVRDGIRWGPGARDTLEFRTMMGFLLAIGGVLGRFLYRNIDDWRVFQNQIGIGDGATTSFILTRSFGANGYSASEPVGMVDLTAGAPVPFAAYLNESSIPLDPSKYTLSTANPVANTLTFASPPPLGASINVDMAYYYYCKLAENSNTVEKFMDRLWKLDKVALHSCRPGA